MLARTKARERILDVDRVCPTRRFPCVFETPPVGGLARTPVLTVPVYVCTLHTDGRREIVCAARVLAVITFVCVGESDRIMDSPRACGPSAHPTVQVTLASDAPPQGAKSDAGKSDATSCSPTSYDIATITITVCFYYRYGEGLLRARARVD